MKYGGNSSHVSASEAIYPSTAGLTLVTASLSALVNTIEKGTLLCPSQSINSRSMAWNPWRMSISTNTFTSCSRCRMYDVIICSSFFCTTFERLAYPYPGRSTRYHSLFIIKWLMSSVFPGVADVLARFLWLHNIFIRLDFPTLLLPMKAYSGFTSLGHIVHVGLLITNSDLLMSI